MRWRRESLDVGRVRDVESARIHAVAEGRYRQLNADTKAAQAFYRLDPLDWEGLRAHVTHEFVYWVCHDCGGLLVARGFLVQHLELAHP
jgi:hypothetical protein